MMACKQPETFAKFAVSISALTFAIKARMTRALTHTYISLEQEPQEQENQHEQEIPYHLDLGHRGWWCFFNM